MSTSPQPCSCLYPPPPPIFSLPCVPIPLPLCFPCRACLSPSPYLFLAVRAYPPPPMFSLPCVPIPLPLSFPCRACLSPSPYLFLAQTHSCSAHFPCLLRQACLVIHNLHKILACFTAKQSLTFKTHLYLPVYKTLNFHALRYPFDSWVNS